MGPVARNPIVKGGLYVGMGGYPRVAVYLGIHAHSQGCPVSQDEIDLDMCTVGGLACVA